MWKLIQLETFISIFMVACAVFRRMRINMKPVTREAAPLPGLSNGAMGRRLTLLAIGICFAVFRQYPKQERVYQNPGIGDFYDGHWLSVRAQIQKDKINVITLRKSI